MKMLRTALIIAGASILTTAALAIANRGDDGPGRKDRVVPLVEPAPGPGPGFHREGDLTYAEFHVRRSGKAVVLRLDRGKVKSVAADSITITENDGNDVTIPIDKDTRVFAGPGRRSSPKDLKAGQTVMVHREAGKAADFIGVPPGRGEVRRAIRPGGDGGRFMHRLPPPPGAPAP